MSEDKAAYWFADAPKSNTLFGLPFRCWKSLTVLTVLFFGFAGLLCAPISRAQGDLLDVFIARVRPDKISEFEGINQRIVDANRRNNGDHVIVMQAMYGQFGTYVFISQRQDYAAIDKAGIALSNAVSKAFGEQGADKIFFDMYSCLISGQTELRRRRPDLGRKAPADENAYAKLIGNARVVRTSVVSVKPGHNAEFEFWLKEAKTYGDRSAEAQPLLVSQLADGGGGGTYYLSAFRSSLGGFDKDPSLKEMVGEENFAKLQKILGEVVESIDTTIYYFRPSLSYPPQAIVDAAPSFWQPKNSTPAARAE